MLVNIYMKFHEDVLNGFQVTERTQFCDRKTQTDGQTELWFLHSAYHHMVLNICMMFHEDILKDFQVTEQTRFFDRKTDRQMDRQPWQKQYVSQP